MKECLDVLVVQRSPTESREGAKALIVSGVAYINGQEEDRAGVSFSDTAQIEVRGSILKYMSRGGLKLGKAMSHFGAELEEKVCMDMGAFTGGFTGCVLQSGTAKVYSVDVGRGQLAWKLRNDDHAVCMEETNIRYVTPEDIGGRIRLINTDMPFISLTKVLGSMKALFIEDGQIVCLTKPQFEAGREKVGRKGVIEEKSVHLEVIRMMIQYALSIGFRVLNLEYSPIEGPEGNIEYLLYLQNHGGNQIGDHDGSHTGDHDTVADEKTVIHSHVPMDSKMIMEGAHASLDK